MAKIVECVPNFSAARNPEEVEAIIDVVRSAPGVTLLDYAPDNDHNRTVVTFIGPPDEVAEAAFQLAKKAAEVIDMSKHSGGHPRIGAMDVCPFIPVRDVSMEECSDIARRVGERIGRELNIPVYLYEEAASKPERKNLPTIRKGEYEGFFEKIKKDEWAPDFGPQEMNAKSGCTVIGARFFLIAYNINLATDNMEIANAIAKKIRFIGGGLRFVKAMAVKLEDRGIVQISMNLVNFEKTAIYQAFEMVKMECRRYGVSVVGSEVVGLVPSAALIASLEYYLQLENFRMDQVLEYKLGE